MKTSRFSESQVALRQVDDGVAVGEICRKLGISEQTYYRWRKKYGGMMPSELKRLRQLEEENQRIKTAGHSIAARITEASRSKNNLMKRVSLVNGDERRFDRQRFDCKRFLGQLRLYGLGK
jgi:putative transposase